MPHYLVFLILQFIFIACGCQALGSRSNVCDNDGKCICSIGYDGDKCNKCKNNYYETQGGCSGTSIVVNLMCLSLQQAVKDLCTIYKVLGSICYRHFGNILEILAH